MITGAALRRTGLLAFCATTAAVVTVVGGTPAVRADTTPTPSCTPATPAQPVASCTETFGYSGGEQTFTVPFGVMSITAVVDGAGVPAILNASTSSLGGQSIGTLTVHSGQQFGVSVGGSGEPYGSPPTFGGGGAGGQGTHGPSYSGYSGGGGSFVFDPQGAPLIVAGGAGGSSDDNCSANAGGGGLQAAVAGCDSEGGINGGPGTMSSGGTQGTNSNSDGLGGSGPASGDNPGTGGRGGSSTYGGGGGGGGYYGGGGGAGSQTVPGDGGGGSAYLAPSVTSGGGTAGGGSNSDGSVTFSWTPPSVNGGSLTCDATANTCSDTFGVDGATPSTAVLQTFVAPPDVTSVVATVNGAGATYSPAGGQSTGTIATTGGTAYQVLVGAQGYHANGKAGTPGTAGGGGAGGNSFAANGGESGGGGSFVFDGKGGLLLAAGGAGGAGSAGNSAFVCAGGTGGGAGKDASDPDRVNAGGYACGSVGDAQGSTPGAGTGTSPGNSGGQVSGITPGAGGKGAPEYESSFSAGGGGGGYAGGAGGSALDENGSTIVRTPGGGGGGSGYAAPSVGSVTGKAGGGSAGDGSVVFTWASTLGATSCTAATSSAASQCTDTYGVSASPQAFVVPPGVTSVTATVNGGSSYSARGGQSVGTVAVTAGQVLPLLVGSSAGESSTPGPDGGGGPGGTASGGGYNLIGYGGAGGSFVFAGSGAPLLVAGGSGGNGDGSALASCTTGNGGSAVPAAPATSGSQTASCAGGSAGGTTGGAGGQGSAGSGSNGAVAAAFLAGTGGQGASANASFQAWAAGGGGGGYAGGGGGGVDNVADSFGEQLGGGGGGGSGYADPSVTNVSGKTGATAYGAGGSISLAYTSGATELTAPSAPTTATAGTPYTFTVDTADSQGEATPWGGTLSVTSSTDPNAELPAATTQTGQTSATFGVTFHKAGVEKVTVTDGTDNLSPVTITVNVSPGPATQLLLTPANANVTDLTSQAYTAQTADQYLNPIAPDTNVVYTSGDVGASCSGTSCTPVTPTTHTITGTDTITMLKGTAMLTGKVAPTTSLTATGPTGAAAGVPVNITVAANGLAGLSTSYTGTVHLTSTDTKAALPADYTFTSADAGKHVFAVTFGTPGTRTVTATDTTNATLTSTTGNIAVTPGPAASFTATAPTTATVGSPVVVSVTPYDSEGNVTSYSGKLHIASSDRQARLPDDAAYTPNASGVDSVPVTLGTAGTQTVTVSDPVTGDNITPGTTGPVTVQVLPGSATRLVLTPANASVPVGTSQSYTAQTADDYGNVIAADPSATFTVDGVACPTAGCSPPHVGSHTVTAVDTNGLRGTAHLTGTAGAVTHLVVTDDAPNPTPAGTTTHVIVTAEDAGNDTVAYTGTVHFTSTDGSASLPDDYTFSPSDFGAQSFNVTLNQAGSQTVTATDKNTTALTGTTPTITVGPGPVVALTASTPGTAVAGQSVTVTVTPVDAEGNAAAYAGTLHVTSSDGKATLPDDAAFTAGPDGTEAVPVTFATTGSQTVTVADKNNGVNPGTTAPIQVSPGSVTRLTAVDSDSQKPANYPAGTPVAITVTTLDGSGNAAPYSGTVTLTSSDSSVAAMSYGFAGATSHTFSIPATLAPSTTFTATASDASVASGSTSVPVIAAVPASIRLTPPTASVPVRTGQSYAAEEYDSYGNDAGPDTNVSYTITGGTCTANMCTPSTTGPHTVTGTDGSLSATASLTATATPVSRLLLIAPATTTAGAPFSVTLTALDGSGHVTSYTGTVTFTSSDAKAVLPADYTFTSADSGSHTFPVTDVTAGQIALTVADKGNASLTGSATTTVAAGPAVTLTLSPVKTNGTIGTGQGYTATASDAYGNSLGDVTASTTFTIAPDGTCAGAVCTPSANGTHGILGRFNSAAGTAELDVSTLATPAAPAVPVVPAALTISAAKKSIAYGKKVGLTGRLTQAGLPLAGQQVSLTTAYTGGPTRAIGVVTTAADGSWRFTTAPAYNAVITARALSLTAKTMIAVTETYNRLHVSVSGSTVRITGRMTPGFVPTKKTRLTYTLTIRSGRKVTTMKAPARQGTGKINHGYLPIDVSYQLPVGRYVVTLTVSGAPASARAATRKFGIVVREPRVLSDGRAS